MTAASTTGWPPSDPVWVRTLSSHYRPLRRAYRTYRDGRAYLRHAYQRLTRGYDDLLVYSMTSELPRLLGEALGELAQMNHGYPTAGGWDEWTWEAALRQHSRALLAYAREDIPEPRNEAHRTELRVMAERRLAAARQAFEWVGQYLPDLWD